MPTSFEYNSTSPKNTQGFAFNIGQLREEILADGGITTDLGHIIGTGKEDIDVHFIAALSGGEETALNAVVAAHVPSDFGITNYEFKECTTEKSTTASSFVNYTTLTTSSLEAGDYRIGWFYIWNGSNSNRDFVARLVLDDLTTEEDELMRQWQEPRQEAGNHKFPASGFTIQTLPDGVHDIKLEFRRGDASATATIFEARIEILKVN